MSIRALKRFVTERYGAESRQPVLLVWIAIPTVVGTVSLSRQDL